MALYTITATVEADSRNEAYKLFSGAMERQIATHPLWASLPDDGTFGIIRINELYDPQGDVMEFMEKAAQSIPNSITLNDEKTVKLRQTLIQEELDEYVEAVVDKKDIYEVAKEIADMLYVVYGAAVDHGINIVPIFHEVQRSNMSKFIDGYRREDGKWCKGPSYTKANIKPLIEAQIKASENG